MPINSLPLRSPNSDLQKFGNLHCFQERSLSLEIHISRKYHMLGKMRETSVDNNRIN